MQCNFFEKPDEWEIALSNAVRKKRFVKQLKKDLNHGKELGEDDWPIDHSVDRLVFSTMWAIALNKSYQEWLKDLELPLLCLGRPIIDLEGLRETVAEVCKKEIAKLKGFP